MVLDGYREENKQMFKKQVDDGNIKYQNLVDSNKEDIKKHYIGNVARNHIKKIVTNNVKREIVKESSQVIQVAKHFNNKFNLSKWDIYRD